MKERLVGPWCTAIVCPRLGHYRNPFLDVVTLVYSTNIHCSKMHYSCFRWKLPSCQSAEDRGTRAISTTTKRRMSASQKRKSVQKSLQSSSEWAKGPIRAHMQWDILCTHLRVKVELRPSCVQNNCLVPSFHKRLSEVLLAMILLACI